MYNALAQTHIRRLAECNFIVERDGGIELTAEAKRTRLQLDIAPDQDIPWSRYHLLLGAFYLAVSVAVLVASPSLRMVPVGGVRVGRRCLNIHPGGCPPLSQATDVYRRRRAATRNPTRTLNYQTLLAHHSSGSLPEDEVFSSIFGNADHTLNRCHSVIYQSVSGAHEFSCELVGGLPSAAFPQQTLRYLHSKKWLSQVAPGTKVGGAR